MVTCGWHHMMNIDGNRKVTRIIKIIIAYQLVMFAFESRNDKTIRLITHKNVKPCTNLELNTVGCLARGRKSFFQIDMPLSLGFSISVSSHLYLIRLNVIKLLSNGCVCVYFTSKVKRTRKQAWMPTVFQYLTSRLALLDLKYTLAKR